MNWRKHTIQALLTLSGSSIPANYKKILELSQTSRSTLQTYQREHLVKLLMHANEHVPYYSHVFEDIGLVRSGTVYLEAFPDVPVLTKDIIRENWKDLQATDGINRHTYENTSGGSTGMPITLVQDAYYSDWNIANKLYYAHAVGKDIGDSEIKLWGSERDIFEGSIGLKEKLMNFLYNRSFHNAFKIDEDSIKSFIDMLNAKKPRHIWAYVDSAFYIAQYILRHKISVHNPNSMIVTAGVLTEDMRKAIEKAFGTQVYNQYGSREVGDIAAEGPDQNGLNVFEWTHYVEIIDEHILVTLLTNYSMPLIRYRIGDTGSLMKTPAHDKPAVQRIDSVTGRSSDHFKLRDGSVVHGEYFTHLFYFKDWVKKFRVIQTDYDEVECIVVVYQKPSQKDLDTITRDIKVVMTPQTRVRYTFTDMIQPSKSGKYLYTESKV